MAGRLSRSFAGLAGSTLSRAQRASSWAGSYGEADNSARNAEILRRRAAGERPAEIAQALRLTPAVVSSVCYRAGACPPRNYRRTRSALGEAVASAKLGEPEVRFIRRFHTPHDTALGTAALARIFGVSEDAVNRVIRRQTWRHVEA